MSLLVSGPSLAIHIDSTSGRLVAVRNLVRDLDLIAAPPSCPPFRLKLEGTDWVASFIRFAHQSLENGLRLTWQTMHDITLESDILVRGEDILFTISAHNQGQATIDRIEYPILSNIGRLGGAGQDEFVHSHATGMLFHDPVDLFEEDPEYRRRLRYSFYPEGYHGATMQMMAYYARGRGGFFIGTEDSAKALKWQ